MDWRRANERWERLIEIIEAMGFVEDWRKPSAERTYRRGRDWYGVGSSYLTLSDGEVTITVRISDHAPKAGGGMRYSAILDDYDRAGEADVSIHPGSEVTLRNVRRHIEAALERARRELEAEDDEPTPAPANDAPAAPVVPAPVDPEVARERERLAAEKQERKRLEKERRAKFREEWQALRATLTPEHFRRWRQLGNGRPGAKALAAEMGVRPAVLYAALTGGGRY
jgi:hypothetical protein